jgi:hypothetical protein
MKANYITSQVKNGNLSMLELKTAMFFIFLNSSACNTASSLREMEFGLCHDFCYKDWLQRLSRGWEVNLYFLLEGEGTVSAVKVTSKNWLKISNSSRQLVYDGPT